MGFVGRRRTGTSPVTRTKGSPLYRSLDDTLKRGSGVEGLYMLLPSLLHRVAEDGKVEFVSVCV